MTSAIPTEPLGALATRLWTLRSRYVSYSLVGLFKTFVDFAVFNAVLLGLSDRSTLHLLFANTFGFLTATAVGFALHRAFTFRASGGKRSLASYIAVSTFGLLVYSAVLLGVSGASTDPLVLNGAKAGGLLLSASWNFLGYRYLVFRDGAFNGSQR